MQIAVRDERGEAVGLRPKHLEVMGRKRKRSVPENAQRVTTYAEFENFINAFARGRIGLLVAIGRPGLGKSQSIKKAIGDSPCLLVKGRKSPLDLYIDLYNHQDFPVVIDDADDLMKQRLCQSYLKALTETDEYKRLDWGTQTKILAKQEVPKHFFTKSPVCIATNYWNDGDPIFEALESRAEIVDFDPTWPEVYAKCAEWFPDQEILDYAHVRLPDLKNPDMRILTKALQRKQGQVLDWRESIDRHCDDEAGMLVRQLIDDKSIPTNQERAAEFVKAGYGQATFYRKLKELKLYRPNAIVERRLAAPPSPPTERPSDGFVKTSAE